MNKDNEMGRVCSCGEFDCEACIEDVASGLVQPADDLLPCVADGCDVVVSLSQPYCAQHARGRVQPCSHRPLHSTETPGLVVCGDCLEVLAEGRVQAAGMNDDESVDEWWQRLLDTLDKCLGLTTGPNVPHRFCCWHDVRGTDVCCMCQVNPCEEANRDVR